MRFTLTDIVLISVRVLIVLAFIAMGWRDIVRLFRRPVKTLGTGLSRVWAVARTTWLEAWAGRVWILPVLWLIFSIILINVIRPYDESERMPLNIRTLLDTQALLLLVMMWVMSCVSLPRERERKIIMTNASKPLSRLEIVLGKMVGFSFVAGIMLLVMGVMSLGILEIENLRIKNTAREAYALQQKDFSRGGAGAAAAGLEKNVDPESTRRLADEGSLFAYNYIVPPRNGMSIMGQVMLDTSPPRRFLKGGSSEKATYHFAPRIQIQPQALFAPQGTRPYFQFWYNVDPFAAVPPSKVQIHVSAIRADPYVSPPPRAQEKTLTLSSMGQAAWEPDEPDQLFSYVGPNGDLVDMGSVNVDVTCITPGVFLEVWEGSQPNAMGQLSQDAAFNVTVIPDRTQPYQFAPEMNPVMRGYERRDRQEVSGPRRADLALVTDEGGVPLETALYRFSANDLKHVPVDKNGNFQLSLLAELDKPDFADKATQAQIMVQNTDALRRKPFITVVTVPEKRLLPIPVPRENLGDSGDMYVFVSCITPGHLISLAEDSVRIELPQSSFALNLLKSEVIIFFQAVLLIVICVTCSVRLGWPVAMLLACVCVIFGWFVEFIAGLQEYGGLGALNYHATGQPSPTFNFLDRSASLLWSALTAISSFVPNFTIYHPTDYISNLQNTPWSVLGWNLFWTVVFILPFVGISYLLFRKQEVG